MTPCVISAVFLISLRWLVPQGECRTASSYVFSYNHVEQSSVKIRDSFSRYTITDRRLAVAVDNKGGTPHFTASIDGVLSQSSVDGVFRRYAARTSANIHLPQ
jgi:hypothetical protein